MSRDGREHREDQAAEDQDEPKQQKNRENHKYNIHTLGRDDINGLTSETATLASRSNLKFQNIISTGHKYAADHRNVH